MSKRRLIRPHEVSVELRTHLIHCKFVISFQLVDHLVILAEKSLLLVERKLISFTLDIVARLLEAFSEYFGAIDYLSLNFGRDFCRHLRLP